MSHYSAIFIILYTESPEFHSVDEWHNVQKKETFNTINTLKNNNKEEFHRICFILVVIPDSVY